MSIQWTSRLSLAKVSDNLRGLKLELYTAIRAWDPIVDGPGPSIEDLAQKTGRKESSISGRCNELRDDDGVILNGPMKTNKTGFSAVTYVALAWRESNLEPEIEPSGQTRFF
ncbi:MAG: hypothetical protein AAGJ81_01585 [Verrucomicrobiota bacterium]